MLAIVLILAALLSGPTPTTAADCTGDACIVVQGGGTGN